MSHEILPAAAPPPSDLLEARGISRSFGPTPALVDASLSVAAGEILAVMGPSGSGKSTLLHCLAGIFTPDAGEVWFDGTRLDTLGETKRTQLRRTTFGFVYQFGQLVPELTVTDNIALPLLLAGVKRKQAYTRAAAWLDPLGLDGLGGRRTGELSGGEAQRVAVARALVARPRVLFADEPTGSLDSLTGEHVLGLLVGLAREEDTTVVLVTHDARVAANADREVMVRDGRVTNPYSASTSGGGAR
jgi:putative ABC transport system ATP-binding protein